MSGLHIKFRPNDFDEFVGNKTVINSIKSILSRPLGDQPRTFLFTGPPGTGKTSMGRLLGKIWNVSDWDLFEINSSNNRGIDTAREISERMTYCPTNGKIVLFVFDEVHKATKDFQNAMLKPLEDTPKHVRFILCTTDPGKLEKAVLSRCEIFTFQSQPPGNIKLLLNRVLKDIGKEINASFVENISNNCEGSPRDALKMLDQIMDLSLDEMEGKLKDIQQFDAEMIDLCRSLIKPDNWNEIADKLRGIKEEPETIRLLVLKYFNTCLLKSGNYFHGFVITCFERRFFESGVAGLTKACYSVHYYYKNKLQKKG